MDRSKKNFGITADSAWVWTAIDSDSKYFLHCYAGGRNTESASAFGRGLKNKLDRTKLPASFVTDGYDVYAVMLLNEYGRVTEPSRKGIRGRPPLPRTVPADGLNYAQIVKRRENGILTDVQVRQVYGCVGSEHMNTSFVERLNLTVRTHLRRFVRKGICFSKTLEMLKAAAEVFRMFYNFCRPHGSLEKKEGGRAVRTTPAMEMGLTGHVWSVSELMGFSYRNNINQLE